MNAKNEPTEAIAQPPAITNPELTALEARETAGTLTGEDHQRLGAIRAAMNAAVDEVTSEHADE